LAASPSDQLYTDHQTKDTLEAVVATLEVTSSRVVVAGR
jgi:hypothetical protein